MTDKLDLKKSLDGYRARRHQFRVVELAPLQYLMIDGFGDPNTSPAFAEAIAALYPVAYTLKFVSKQELGRDYVVPPLEGLWSARDMAVFTSARDKSQWVWTLMLLVPDWLDGDAVASSIERVRAKKQPPWRLDEIRFQTLAEGRCVQTLHVGSFDDEAEVLARLHQDFLPGQQLLATGKHHEIYLSDFRKVAPERQRTILRQPVTLAGRQDEQGSVGPRPD